MPWIDTLPIVTADELQDGIYLFIGTIQGVSSSMVYPFFKMENNTQHLISATTSSSRLYHFNIENDMIVSNGVNSSGMNEDLQRQIGTGQRGSYLTNVVFERVDVVGKIYPI